ncbi:MAG TPA: hypothetical protein VHH35_07460 [Pyrinomonadaceae bacterium]|nr:hypothetical protein [Pyrinomonadaceae bacterium]
MVKAVAILILTAFPVVASTSSRVVVRDTVSPAHRDELVDRLRAITGWNDLDFNSDGALRITATNADTGSKSARDLISRAVTGDRVILFEDASSRKDVVFCRVVLGKFLSEPVVEADVYVVLIDFDDFRQVIGDKQARAAFDVGWAVLHEIDHVVQDSQDPKEDTSAGDCESHINKMRRELGLAVRNSYFFSYLPVKNDANLVSRFVRLGFDQVNTASAKRKRYWLIWDAAIVGGLDSDCAEATDRITVSGVRLPLASDACAF